MQETSFGDPPEISTLLLPLMSYVMGRGYLTPLNLKYLIHKEG